jgi:WD40 repeat protein
MRSWPPGPCTLFNTSVSSGAFSSDAKPFYFGGGSYGCIFEWQEEQGWGIEPIFRTGRTVTALTVAPDGLLIAVGEENGRFAVWNLERRSEVLRNLRKPTPPSKRSRFHPTPSYCCLAVGVSRETPNSAFPVSAALPLLEK